MKVRQALGPQGPSSTITATCNAGERVIGGGTDYRESGAARAVIKTSAPERNSEDTPTGWKSQVLNIQSPPTDNVEAFAYVICASP